MASNDGLRENRVEGEMSDAASSANRSWTVVWSLAFAATLPLLIAYLIYIWRFEHYRYFPFALLLCGYLFWQRWDRQILPPSGVLAWGGFVGGLLLLIAGGALYSPWLGVVAFVLLAGGFLWTQRSPSGSRLTLVWLPLLMLVRLPLNYDQQIVVGLQRITTTISSYLLDVFHIAHDTVGNVIQLADRELLVAEACSGVQSAFTLCFIAVAVVAWKRRSPIALPFMVAAALLWALVANVTRVTSIAVAATADVDLSAGWPHELLGYVVLAVATGLVISTDRLFKTTFHPIGSVHSEQSTNPLIRCWDGCIQGRHENPYFSPGLLAEVTPATAMTGPAESGEASAEASLKRKMSNAPRLPVRSWALAGGVVLIGLIANTPVALWSAKAERGMYVEEGGVLIDPDTSLLANLGTKSRVRDHEVFRDGADARLGRHADVWSISHPRFQGELILSQGYREWHDLSICYKNRDWRETRRYITAAPGLGNTARDVAVSIFRNKDGMYAYLLYTGFRESGEVIPPPGNGFFGSLVGRCRGLFDGTRSPGSEYQSHAMLQFWIASPQALSDEALSDALATMGSARDRFADAIAARP